MYTSAVARRLLQAAEALERDGKLLPAKAAYQQLLSQFPDLPDCWYNLALLQRRAGRFEAALASYQQALERGVAHPEEVHLNRAVVYSDHLRRDAAAEAELRTALRINPGYEPALLNLANLHEDQGKRSEAQAAYQALLHLNPGHAEALARYANLSTIHSPDDPLILRLRQALLNDTASAEEKASLGFALGRALDCSGSYSDAFQAYEAANLRSRLSAAGSAPPYDRRAHERHIDQIIHSFSHAGRPAAVTTRGVQPIFICGMFRSGSTLLEQVLARHPQVTSGGELPYLPGLVRSAFPDFPTGIATTAPQVLEQLAGQYCAALRKLFPAAQRVTDKRPDNFLYIGLIKTMFPDARILHTQRNALDNCLSIFFLHLDHSMGYALDLIDTAHYYRQYRRLMAHWKSRHAPSILDFDYDAFVRDPGPAVARLLEFLGLDWADECLRFDDASTSVRTASVWQVREPLYQRSSGRWRNYAEEITDLRRYLE